MQQVAQIWILEQNVQEHLRLGDGLLVTRRLSTIPSSKVDNEGTPTNASHLSLHSVLIVLEDIIQAAYSIYLLA